MNEDKNYIKMSQLVGSTFTVRSVGGYKFKKWDTDNYRMLVSDNWIQGYSKTYQVETDRGWVDMSSAKLGEMLESVSKGGEASIVGRAFSVKSNGKTDLDVRYYINPARVEEQSGFQKAQETYRNIKQNVEAKTQDKVVDDISDEPFDLSTIPF